MREKRTMREENFVPCLVLIVFLAFPRIALVLLYLFSTYLQRAYPRANIAFARLSVLTPNNVGLCVDGEYTAAYHWH